MDLETIEQNLRKAEAQVATGAEQLTSQKQVVTNLAGGVHDTAMARAVLKAMERGFAVQVAAEEQIAEELADAKLKRARDLRVC